MMHIQISTDAVFCYDRDSDWEQYSADERPQVGAHEIADEEILPLRNVVSAGRHHPLTPYYFRQVNGQKPSTLRSWRNPRAIGGDCRKATARKLERRVALIG